MKLVTYIPNDPTKAPARGGIPEDHAGIVHGDQLLDLSQLGEWAAQNGLALPKAGLPTTTLTLLQMGPEGMAIARAALDLAAKARPEDLLAEPGLAYAITDVTLRTPVPTPPTLRDFYVFEQHVKAARARRGLGMIPEWYEFPVFYFSNTASLYGDGEPVPFPRHSQEVDFELEIAAVIGRAGRDISAEDAPSYIAGYMIMNDWSARDRWRKEAPLSMGPAKGKDFASSLGPWVVTPDELDDRRVGFGKDERYDLVMTARINGDQLSSDNAKTMYYGFPQMIERASEDTRLRPGDVIGSGTCGTGCILELGTERHRWLLPGDVVELEIERLGALRNTLVEQKGR